MPLLPLVQLMVWYTKEGPICQRKVKGHERRSMMMLLSMMIFLSKLMTCKMAWCAESSVKHYYDWTLMQRPKSHLTTNMTKPLFGMQTRDVHNTNAKPPMKKGKGRMRQGKKDDYFSLFWHSSGYHSLRVRKNTILQEVGFNQIYFFCKCINSKATEQIIWWIKR